jgi:hypothetical protein
VLKIWSAKEDAKSIVNKDFKNPELFSINDNDGVIVE